METVKQIAPSRPPALFDAEGRKRLAKLLVWGSGGQVFTRHDIETRIQSALARIAERVDGQ